MIKKSLYEELTIHIDKEELAQLLGVDAGYSVDMVEEEKGTFRITLSRKTMLDETADHSQSIEASREQTKRRNFL